jgi:hypothetical protein
MSASHVYWAVGVLLIASKPHIDERDPFPQAFTADVAKNGRRVHRSRPSRVCYSDAESARAGEGERHE